jgi:hypothetical protein
MKRTVRVAQSVQTGYVVYGLVYSKIIISDNAYGVKW